MKRRLLDTLDLIRFNRPVGTLLLFLPSGWSILLARPGETAWGWLALFFSRGLSDPFGRLCGERSSRS